MSRATLGLLAAAFVSGAWVSAQEPTYTLKVDVPYVSVDFTVRDTAGSPVSVLTRDDFELYENGIRQQIGYFSPASAPYNVFLLFDRSGSTQHKWPFMQRAVASLISGLRLQDHFAIGTFADQFDMQLNWTVDRSKVLQALPELINARGIGRTNFYDALDRSLLREFRKVTGRRALLVLTDGRDTSLYLELAGRNRLLDPDEDRNFQKALKAAREQRIPTYFVALNTDRNLEPNTLGGDEYRDLQIIYRNSPIPQKYLEGVRARMEQIADASGGHVLYPKTIEDIVPMYQQMGRELGLSYTVGYVSSNPAKDSSYRRIEVRTRDGKLGLTQSRAGYYPK